jgi:hypothetical protein
MKLYERTRFRPVGHTHWWTPEKESTWVNASVFIPAEGPKRSDGRGMCLGVVATLMKLSREGNCIQSVLSSGAAEVIDWQRAARKSYWSDRISQQMLCCLLLRKEKRA